MASNGNSERRLLTTGGVLSIVGGVPQIICGGVLIVAYLAHSFPHQWLLIEPLFLPFFPSIWRHSIVWQMFPYINFVPPTGWAIIIGCIGILGIVAAIGGVSAIRRRSFGLSLAGAICALVWVPLGILAVIFVVLGKREFDGVRV